MSLSVRFNGSELNKYINVLRGFTPRKGVSWAPQVTELSAGTRGAKYKTTAYKSKTIPMPFSIEGNIEEKYNELERILNVNEPKELIFGSTPSKVYYAIPNGNLDLEEMLYFGEGTIEWVVPEGVAYSLAETTATNNGTTTEITLKNNGTESVPINVAALMKSENGYLGLTLDDRFYQIGHPEEVDGVSYEASERLFDDHLYRDCGWALNQGITPPVTPERLQSGTITYVKESGTEGYAKVSNYKTGDSWHGAALTKTVPTDANGEYPENWRCDWRFDFNTVGAGSDAGKQVGHNSVTFSDADDNIIVSVVFEDNNTSLERSDMAIYIGQKRVWDTKNTTKFYVTGREGDGACIRVEKIGENITVKFSYAGISKTFKAEDSSAKLRKITWYGAGYKTNSTIRNNLLRAINVVKHNVQKYDDIPNYFQPDDEIYLDGNSNKLYINGILDWDTVDIGSQPLLLPPGEHTLGIVTSTFSQVPEVTVTYRERWL